MKGLLIKDFKLLKMNINFFLIIIAIEIGISAFSNEALSFILGFLPFVISSFALSTISYDEFDNGISFLFSLPVTRIGYVIEKYLLGFILGTASLILSAFMIIIIDLIKGINLSTDIIEISFTILASIVIILSIMLPLQLKFGSEKRKIVIFVVVGLILLIGITIKQITHLFDIDIFLISKNFSIPSTPVLIIIYFLTAIVISIISMLISISIVNKKDF